MIVTYCACRGALLAEDVPGKAEILPWHRQSVGLVRVRWPGRAGSVSSKHKRLRRFAGISADGFIVQYVLVGYTSSCTLETQLEDAFHRTGAHASVVCDSSRASCCCGDARLPPVTFVLCEIITSTRTAGSRAPTGELPGRYPLDCISSRSTR